MSFLEKLLPWRKKSASTWDVFRDYINGRATYSGKTVSVDTAIQVSAVLACCRVIGNGLAQIPLKLMLESTDGKSRLPAKDHPLYSVLATKPNSWMTSFEYRELLAWHIVLCGQHFSFINRGVRGIIHELIPFDPASVTVKRDADGVLSYEVRGASGSVKAFPASSIWHVRGSSWNGWQGLKAIDLAREAVGLAMATEQAVGQLHKNGVRPSGVYSVEGSLSPEQYKGLKNWIDNELSGNDNAGAALILDRGAKWINTQMSGIDAQSLETRKFQTEEICRHFGVNPIMIFAESKNSTYASAEQMFLSHVVHTLAPWYQRIEQSIDANLLTEKEREQGLYACFVEEGLLRGSLKDTKDYLLGLVNGGLMTPNEARAKLDLNPDGDPESENLRIPANIVGSVPLAN